MQPPITLIDETVLAEAKRRAEVALVRAIDAGMDITQTAGVFRNTFWKAVDELTQSEEPSQGEHA